jgi:Asp-tRNA(Asn)/Glu-tRNA(Gln) amidotransferase A subunit family amidase
MKRIKSPRSTHPLDLSAANIARGIRARRFLTKDVVAESLRRAESLVEPLNPFTVIRKKQAIESAAAADRAVELGYPLGPLHGVPFAAKDLTPTAGDLTTRGSWTAENWHPEQSALIVRRLEHAGAILVAKTTTPEFAHAGFTASPRWGITRNPWDPSRTSGGSSGGSAVAVACGVVPFAEGTDMGGSIRMPAALCGVVGFKPSLGRIPMTILPSLFDNISHFGPLARSVDDAITFLQATAGSSDEDISSLPLEFRSARARKAVLSGKRFALSIDLGHYAVDPEVEAMIRRAARAIEAAGGIVEEVRLDWTRAVTDQILDIWCVFMSAFFGDLMGRYRNRMDPTVVSLIERGMTLDATTYKRIEMKRTALWRDMAGIFSRFDALLCPTCALVAPSAELTDDDFYATLPDGRFGGLDMTCAFNQVGQCPVLSLPVGLTASGLPVGMQIVGHRYADEDVLAIALACEKAMLRAGYTSRLPVDRFAPPLGGQ